MKNFYAKFQKILVLSLALLIGFPASGWAGAKKGGKFTAATRMVIANRDGKIHFEKGRALLSELRKQKKQQSLSIGNIPLMFAESMQDDGSDLSVAPVQLDGREYVQCWITLTNDKYSELEKLGVKIQGKFSGKVTAHVPVDAMEKVAGLDNVTKVGVAKMLRKKTYVGRQLTNVDDILNYTNDAQTAGLLHSYDGTGVVLGVIDTGIDFGHDMLKGSRLKKKYVYNSTSEEMQEYTGTTVYYTDETHGTHTSTIAGGSNLTSTAYVYTTGTGYSTVNNAAFGGMAPGTDLVLCDLGEYLSDANIAWSMQKIAEYAASVNKPYVISLSLGGHYGPHDGTGDMADVCEQLTGPGKVIVFAAGNEGEDGIYLGKNASATDPSQTVLSSQTRSSYSMDYGAVVSYARTPNTELAVRYHVVNTSTNAVLWTSNEITTDDYFVDDQGNVELYGAEISVNDTGSDGTTKLSNYFTAYNNDANSYGFLCGYMDLDPHNNKWYVETILYYLKAVSTNYKIAMSVYPKTGTSYVDSWPVSYIDFTASSARYNNVTFTAGSNESSASDESHYPSIISVGSYVSSKYWRAGTTSATSQAWSNNGTYRQISMFSSYQPEGSGPTGLKQPWITAPGEVVIAGYNTGYTAESNYYYAYGSNKKLGAMSGTSMACPCAAGICALWLQANPQLTPAQIKTVMKETAITDTYTSGTYASHFGQGKIDALAGLEQILAVPTIIASPSEIDFADSYVTKTYTKTITVTGTKLEGNITVAKSGSGMFTVDKTSITQSGGNASATLTVTYAPTAVGTHTGTITLTSTGAETVTIALSGTAAAATPGISVDKSSLSFDAGLDESTTQTFTVSGRFLSQNVTATLNDANGVFSIDKTNLNYVTLNADGTIDVNVTFRSTAEGSFTGSVVLSSTGASNVTVNLSATAQDGGKASDAWLDIAKYATIDDAGWNTSYVNNLYKYTEYADSECAWLTLPVYGGFVGVYYNSHPQAWIESSLGTSNTYGGTTWTNTASATNPFQGSSAYFTTATARAIGYNSRTNTAVRTVSFYVTNTTEVRLNGTGRSGVSATYPASLRVYECTKNANGTVTASTTATVNQTSTSTTTFTLSGTGLDATKIYKVECSIYRGYLYEVAFKTPITVNPELTVSPTSLSFSTMVGTPAQQTFTLTGKGLTGNVTAAVSGEGFTVSPTSMTAAQAKAGQTLTVTYNPSARGSHTGTVTLSSAGATSVSVALTGEAMPAYFDLTVSKYGLSTMYLDFPVTIPYDDFEDLLGVYTVKSIVNGELRLARLNRNIPANTGVIVQANSGTYRFPTNTGTVTALTYENQLQGVVENTPKNDILATAPAGTSIYTLGLGPSGYVGFYRFSGATVRANSAYILYDESAAGVKGLTVVFEDGTTAIQPTRVEEEGDGVWYTVQGARLSGSPKTRGVYIHNGKKVLVK